MPSKSPHPLLPSTVLSIYCLQGVVPENQEFPDSIFIGNWLEDGHSFLFFLKPVKSLVQALIDKHGHLQLLDSYTMTYEQWQGGSIEPVRIGRFILNPPWIKASPRAGELAITLDAGVVFGNGAHPTTLDCLQAIEIACAGGRVDTMLDLGTGTGVLALAAAKLGCGRIIAVDYNLLAAQTAQRNVWLNDLGENILVVNGRAEMFTSIPSDLLVANIHYDVMSEIVQSEGFLRQKWFVLSGLLHGEAEKIADILSKKPVLVLKRWGSSTGWQTILGITENDG